jgi:hypothetical protein
MLRNCETYEVEDEDGELQVNQDASFGLLQILSIFSLARFLFVSFPHLFVAVVVIVCMWILVV